MRESVDICTLLKNALTDDIDNREIILKIRITMRLKNSLFFHALI